MSRVSNKEVVDIPSFDHVCLLRSEFFLETQTQLRDKPVLMDKITARVPIRTLVRWPRQTVKS